MVESAHPLSAEVTQERSVHAMDIHPALFTYSIAERKPDTICSLSQSVIVACAFRLSLSRKAELVRIRLSFFFDGSAVTFWNDESVHTVLH